MSGEVQKGEHEGGAFVHLNTALSPRESYKFRVRHRFRAGEEFRRSPLRKIPEVLRLQVSAVEAKSSPDLPPPPADPELRKNPEAATSPPASVFGLFNIPANRGAGFHATPGGLMVLIRDSSDSSGEVEQIFPDIRPEEWHDYELRYDSKTTEVSLWVDGTLLVQRALIWVDYSLVMGVTAWEGEGIKQVDFADFSSFVLERAP